MDTEKNSATRRGGARTQLNLIDAIDLLNEAREMNEVAFMACESIGNRTKSGAMQRILSLCGDTMRNVADNLEAIRAEAREGGAA